MIIIIVIIVMIIMVIIIIQGYRQDVSYVMSNVDKRKYMVYNLGFKSRVVMFSLYVFCTMNTSCYVSKNTDFLHNLTKDTLIEKYKLNNNGLTIKPNDILRCFLFILPKFARPWRMNHG